jgi:hypothetical protein
MAPALEVQFHDAFAIPLNSQRSVEEYTFLADAQHKTDALTISGATLRAQPWQSNLNKCT